MWVVVENFCQSCTVIFSDLVIYITIYRYYEYIHSICIYFSLLTCHFPDSFMIAYIANSL